MADAFQQLISFWRKAGLDGDAESIADSLWLASFLPTPPKTADQPNAPVSRLDTTTASNAAGANANPSVAASDNPQPPRGVDPGGLFPKPAAPVMEATTAATLVSIAAAAALPNALVLSRALRPFSRRFASRTRTEFDEERTAEESIRNRRPTPHYRPLPERWFDVALVVEDTPSMAIWRRSLWEFRTLLERQGSFRDVRAWRLQPNGQLLDRQTVRRPGAIGDSTGRRLILIASDCVSADWSNGVIASLALRWGKQTPVAIVQVLPPRAWSRTALGEPSSVLRSPRAGLPTAGLKLERTWWSPEITASSITVPVVPLDAAEVLSWARMSMAMGGATYPGVLLDANPAPLPGNVKFVGNDQDPRAMVGAYQEMVSAEAFQLAAYLAAAPLSLPIMRLVQQAMFGGRTRQFHLAEFFLGGLIRKVAEASDPEDTTYDFHEGVRAALLETLQRNDAFEVIRRVSGFVEDRIGQPLDWKALVPDAAGTDRLPEAALPFAKVAREVLGRLGVGARGSADNVADVVSGPVPDAPPEVVLSSQPLEKVLSGHTGPVTSVVVTTLGGRPVVVSASDDRTIRIWDLLSGSLLRTVPGPLHPVLALNQTESGLNEVYGGGEDGIARIWDIKTGQSQDLLTPEYGPITAIAAPTLWGHQSGRIDVFDFGRSGQLRFRSSRTSDKTRVNVLVRVPESRSLFLSASDDSARFLSEETDTEVKVYSTPARTAVITIRDRLVIAILGSLDGAIRFWNGTDNREFREPLKQNPVSALSLLRHNGTEYLISGSTDGKLRVWSLDNFQLVGAPIFVHQGSINSVAVHEVEGGGWVAVSVGDDCSVRVTDLRAALATRHYIMIWNIGPESEINESIKSALLLAGHRVAIWDRSIAARNQLPLCGHVVAIIAGALAPGALNPYEEVIQCRAYFLVLGPNAEDPAFLKDATRIRFSGDASRQESLRTLLDGIEVTPPAYVGAVQSLQSVVFPRFRRPVLEANLKSMLRSPDANEVIHLVSRYPQESNALAQIIANHCDIRRAFPGGIFGVHQSFPQLDSGRGPALLVVTRSALLAGAPRVSSSECRVLVADRTGEIPASAFTFEIPPVSGDETSTYLSYIGVKILPLGAPELIAAYHNGSARKLETVGAVMLAVGPEGWPRLERLLSGPDAEDELIGLAIETLDPKIRQSAGDLVVFRDGEWVPPRVIQTFGGNSAFRLQALGILEQDSTFESSRLHPGARREFPPADSSAHAAVVLSYTQSGKLQLRDLPFDGYFERNIEYHLAHANMADLAIDLNFELSWLTRKLAAVGIRKLLADLSELYAVESLKRINEVLGASAGILEYYPEELAAALLRYPAEPGETTLALLQTQALAQLAPVYTEPSFFVLVSGTGVGSISFTTSTVAKRLGIELARNGFGLITGGWEGVDEITARAYLAERLRLGFGDSKAALIQVVGKRSLKILEEGRVVNPEIDNQAEAVGLANAVVLLEGIGGALQSYKRAQQQNKPVFPIAGTGGDAMRVFQEMIKSDRLASCDAIGRPLSVVEDIGRPVSAAMHKIFLASRQPIPQIINNLEHSCLAQEYLDIRATEPSGAVRTEHMTEVMSNMQRFDRKVPTDNLPALLQSADRGLRLAGMARAITYPDPGMLELLVATLTNEDTPFGQFWCLRAIEDSVSHADVGGYPESFKRHLLAFRDRLNPNSDRAKLLANILSRLGGPPTTFAS